MREHARTDCRFCSERCNIRGRLKHLSFCDRKRWLASGKLRRGSLPKMMTARLCDGICGQSATDRTAFADGKKSPVAAFICAASAASDFILCSATDHEFRKLHFAKPSKEVLKLRTAGCEQEKESGRVIVAGIDDSPVGNAGESSRSKEGRRNHPSLEFGDHRL